MYAYREDTLAGLKQSLLFRPRPMNVSVPQAVERLNAYMKHASADASPEAEALKFYFSNHVFGLISEKFHPHEPLPEPVLRLARGYLALASPLVLRLAYYVLMIITREARHFPGPSSVFEKIEDECGEAAKEFCAYIRHSGEMSAVDKLRKNPPEVSLRAYIKAMMLVFFEGAWGPSYGGPKWGNIAQTLYRLVVGEISPEMFADTAFTLVHNGGPMFNKGMLYSGFDRKRLLTILDVQRSGQIPQHVDSVASLLDAATKGYIREARAVFPEELNGYVDWFRVQALGGIGKYHNEQKEQLAKYGPSKWMAHISEQEAKKRALENAKFYVNNNEYAIKIERVA
jgi:hypothetical protein